MSAVEEVLGKAPQPPVKASEVLDWTRRSEAIFTTKDGGRTATLMSWDTYGRCPHVGDALALANGAKASVYRVTEYVPQGSHADYDGYMVRLVFVPGRDIVRD